MATAAVILSEFHAPDWLGFDVPPPNESFVTLLVQMRCDCDHEREDRLTIITAYVTNGGFSVNMACEFDPIAWAPAPQIDDFFVKERCN